MKPIQLVAKFDIQEGKSDTFREVVQLCIDKVNANEKGKGCLQYDWYFGHQNKVCHVLESYKDSDAVMAHMANVGDLLGALLEISTLSGDIYGDLSPELEKALEGLDVKSFGYYNGI